MQEVNEGALVVPIYLCLKGLALQTINKEQSIAECSVPDYAPVISLC